MIESLPAGMTPRDFQDHPVRQLLRDAAYHGPGGEPTAAELDALGLSDGARDAVRDGCAEVARLNSEGDHQGAWQRGDELAVEILAGLPEYMRWPEHWAPPDPLADVTDPGALAAAVEAGPGSSSTTRRRPARRPTSSASNEDPAALASRVPPNHYL